MNDFPKKEGKDAAHDATIAALNLIPVVGGAVSVIFETVFSSPIDKRKEEWLNRLAQTVEELCVKVDGLTAKGLANNPEFISFYMQASTIAIRTHNEEKLKALNSAVKNSILLKDIDESKKMIFLRIIDQMTPLHFKVFHFLSFPEKYIETLNSQLRSGQSVHWGSMSNVWEECNPDIRAENPIMDIIINDLKNYGLVQIDKFHKAGMQSNVFGFGKDFSRFISDEA